MTRDMGHGTRDSEQRARRWGLATGKACNSWRLTPYSERSERPYSSQRAQRAASPLTSHVSRLSSNPSRQCGFTLIEILAAFVVFVLAFGAVMQALSGSLHNTVRSGNYTEAALLARSKLAGLGLTQALEPGTEQGEFENGYRWRLNIHEYQPPDMDGEALGVTPRVALYEAELTVSWGEEPRLRRVTFSTLRAVQPEL